MFDIRTDRGGGGLAQRARENRYATDAEEMANIDELELPPAVRIQARMNAQFNQSRARSAAEGYNQPWDKMLQALQEAGVDKLADESAPPRQYRADGTVGIVPASNSIARPPDYDPFTMGHANQARAGNASIAGLRRAANPTNNTLRYQKSQSSLKSDPRMPY